jgi:hypothetical protein
MILRTRATKMKHFTKRNRVREVFRSVGVSLGVALATLAALEILLRVADFRELREGLSESSLSYRYDAELGWAPAPGSSSIVTNARTIHVQHNSLGLRDIEFSLDAIPTIMFWEIRSFGAWMLKQGNASPT